jgi:toxin ParE1/3/4
MDYQVFFISDAEEDISEIYKYVSRNDSIQSAKDLFDKLKATCYNLVKFSERGQTPPELERISVLEFKETHYKPYRIIYEIIDNNVYIHCVLDGRRDLQELLQRRLLR